MKFDKTFHRFCIARLPSMANSPSFLEQITDLELSLFRHHFGLICTNLRYFLTLREIAEFKMVDPR